MKNSSKNQKEVAKSKAKKTQEVMSYRLKCSKTANGLSHFVMYGDVPQQKTLL